MLKDGVEEFGPPMVSNIARRVMLEDGPFISREVATNILATGGPPMVKATLKDIVGKHLHLIWKILTAVFGLVVTVLLPLLLRYRHLHHKEKTKNGDSHNSKVLSVLGEVATVLAKFKDDKSE
jgi:hypothetical protein